jgi:hypothetical protein
MAFKLVLEGFRGSCSCDGHNVALLRVEFHAPGLFPGGEADQIFLKGGAISLRFDFVVDDTIVGRKSGLAFELAWQVIDEQEKENRP